MLVAIFGDMHASTSAARYAIEWAGRQGVDKAVWAGDCGYWPTDKNGIGFLDEVEIASRESGVTNFWVGGNHEHWHRWNADLKIAPKDYWGFGLVRTHVRLAPRLHTWKWDGKWWMGLAGAKSIDRKFWTKNESWFDEELITEEEIASVEKMNTDKFHVSYLVTHDAATNTPWGFRLFEDSQSFDNRTKIDRAVRHLHPDMHFHGHYHRKYHWMNGQTETIGLDMEHNDGAMGILDTDLGTFVLRDDKIGQYAFWA